MLGTRSAFQKFPKFGSRAGTGFSTDKWCLVALSTRILSIYTFFKWCLCRFAYGGHEAVAARQMAHKQLGAPSRQCARTHRFECAVVLASKIMTVVPHPFTPLI